MPSHSIYTVLFAYTSVFLPDCEVIAHVMLAFAFLGAWNTARHTVGA